MLSINVLGSVKLHFKVSSCYSRVIHLKRIFIYKYLLEGVDSNTRTLHVCSNGHSRIPSTYAKECAAPCIVGEFFSCASK